MDRKECYKLTHSLSEISGYATVGVEGNGQGEGKWRGGVDILLRDATAAASRPTVGLNPTLGAANQRIAVSAYRSLLASGTQKINDILRTIGRCDNNYYYYTRLTASFPGTAWVSRYQKGKTSLDLTEVRDDGVLGCGGTSWTMCKQSAPRSRQITTPTPHRSIFTGRMLFLTVSKRLLRQPTVIYRKP